MPRGLNILVTSLPPALGLVPFRFTNDHPNQTQDIFGLDAAGVEWNDLPPEFYDESQQDSQNDSLDVLYYPSGNKSPVRQATPSPISPARLDVLATNAADYTTPIPSRDNSPMKDVTPKHISPSYSNTLATDHVISSPPVPSKLRTSPANSPMPLEPADADHDSIDSFDYGYWAVHPISINGDTQSMYYELPAHGPRTPVVMEPSYPSPSTLLSPPIRADTVMGGSPEAPKDPITQKLNEIEARLMPFASPTFQDLPRDHPLSNLAFQRRAARAAILTSEEIHETEAKAYRLRERLAELRFYIANQDRKN